MLLLFGGEETPYSKQGTLARNRVYPENGEQGWHISRGELLFLGFTHTRLLHLHSVTLAREYSKGRGKRKILPEHDLPLSELWPSVCLALSITVSCLTVCCPLALNWGKTAQIQAQLKLCFMGVALNAL